MPLPALSPGLARQHRRVATYGGAWPAASIRLLGGGMDRMAFGEFPSPILAFVPILGFDIARAAMPALMVWYDRTKPKA